MTGDEQVVTFGTLDDHLRDLEESDPKVRAAAERYDREMWRLAFRARMAARRVPEVLPSSPRPQEVGDDA